MFPLDLYDLFEILVMSSKVYIPMENYRPLIHSFIQLLPEKN